MLNYTNAVNAVKSVRFAIRSRCVTFRANRCDQIDVRG